MTDEIRIDDLAAPVLTDIQQMGLDWGESKHTELSVDAVCAAAVERTGLDDFGPDDFRERLGLQLAEMDADPERTGLGRMLFFGDCVRNAANRLLIHDLLARHPEILETEIVAPVIVVGLPRSGTTNLVNLLAADTRFRSMPLWESYEPVPDPNEPAEVDGVDPRWTRSQKAWEAMQAGAPLVAAMHPMEPDHVHEEIELMNPDFASYTHEWVARAPQWRDHYVAHDQTPHYTYMKQVLQILQWYRPARAVGAEVAPAPRAARPAAVDLPRRDRSSSPTATRWRWCSRRPPWSVTGPAPPTGRPGPSGTATTGPSGSAASSTGRWRIGICCRPIARSTCSSTSTWTTRWARSSGSTTRPASS